MTRPPELYIPHTQNDTDAVALRRRLEQAGIANAAQVAEAIFQHRTRNDFDKWKTIQDWGNSLNLGSSGGNVGSGNFGDGHDGTVTLTAASATPQQSDGVTWANRVGSIWTMTRDMYFLNLHISNASGNIDLVARGFRIYVSGTLTIDAGCSINNDGIGQNGALAGSFGAAGGTGGAAIFGGAGAPGGNTLISGATISPIAVQSGGNGGGQTAPPGLNAGPGGTAVCAATNGRPDNITQANINSFSGGAGGGSGWAAPSSTSGAGGGGGGPVMVAAFNLVNSGRISSNGANGGNAVQGAGVGAAGGGGGGGGWVTLIVGTSTGPGIAQVIGGGGGAPAGAGGQGGNSGLPGELYILRVST